MKESIRPSLVLMTTAAVTCMLLVLANALTKDKIEQAQTEKINASLTDTFGSADYSRQEPSAEGINAVYCGSNGCTIFDITESGYSKDGLHLLIGFDRVGKLCGISFLELFETPGLGTKVEEEPGFIGQFIGAPKKPDKFEKITGATFSSKGVKAAVDKAFDAYDSMKGGSGNE